MRNLRVIIGPRSQVLARFQALNREICPSQGPPCPCLHLARHSSSSQDTKDVPLFLGCQSSPFLRKASLKLGVWPPRKFFASLEKRQS